MLEVILAILNAKQLIFAVLLHDSDNISNFVMFKPIKGFSLWVIIEKHKNQKGYVMNMRQSLKASCELYLDFDNGLLLFQIMRREKEQKYKLEVSCCFLI